jgi:D-3-phosphoglycerate dehydrogenase
MRILIVSSIHDAAIKYLKENHHVITAYNPTEADLFKLIQDREILIFRSGVQITAKVMENAPDLELLLRAGSGIDNLDLEYTKSHGIKLVRIPEPGGKAVAEMAFTFMLALSRNLIKANKLTHSGNWAKGELSGFLLNGKILGVIGVGNIGSRVGQMGSSWGMNVIGYDNNPTKEYSSEVSAKGIRLTSFDEVLSTSDYLCIHTPLTQKTRYMISSDQLAMMKPGSYLINLARGGVVDEKALYSALTEDNKLRGAALDVHETEGEGMRSPLAGLPNVILTPHIGAMTIDSQREIGERVIEIINSHISHR